jgi:protein transport protein HofC
VLWEIKQTFRWRAIDRQGQIQHGCDVADNRQQLMSVLQQKQLSLIQAHRQWRLLRHCKRQASLPERLMFIQQLSWALSSHLPIVQSLNLVSQAVSQATLKNASQAMAACISSGQSLSTAAKQQPHIFEPVSLAFITAGETHGQIDTALAHYHNELKQQYQAKKAILRLLSYPCLILIFSLLIAAGLLIFVLPEFQSLYQQFNHSLPLLTRGCLKLSQILVQYGHWLLLGLASLLITTWQAYRRRGFFYQLCHQGQCRLPLFNTLQKTQQLARWYRLSQTLYQAGTPLPQALQLASQSLSLPSLKSKAEKIRQNLERGQPLYQSMQEQHWSPLDIPIIHCSENTGKLEEGFTACSKRHHHSWQDCQQRIKLWLEPAVMLVLALIIGTIVLAIYLPILNLGQLMT